MRHARKSFRRQRGGAVVELAIMMLVLIPLLVYGLFLMDAAYLKLDLQETVVSGGWDITMRNAESGSTEAEVARVAMAVRHVYSDHTSAYDDGVDPRKATYREPGRLNSSTDHRKHHIGFGAHYTFRFSSGTDTEFQCEVKDKDRTWVKELGMDAFARSRFAMGAQVTCTAKGYIYNYIIPKTFMQEFAGDTKMTRLTHRQGSGDAQDPHSAEADRGEDASIETRASAAVSFNTWALLNGSNDGMLANTGAADIGAWNFLGQNTGPTLKQNPFFQRVLHVNTANGPFRASYANVTKAATNLKDKAHSEKLMKVVATPPPLNVVPSPLPNVLETYLRARYQPETEMEKLRQKPAANPLHGGFLSTPYSGVNNNYREAYRKRGPYYLGCKGAEGSKCQ